MKHTPFACLLAVVVASVVTARIDAQAPSRQTAPLRIVVITGEDAVNIIQQKTAVAPVVEVRDRNNLPVPGVAVTFTVGGQSASFGGLSTLTVTTNAAGQAAAAGLTPTVAGTVQINAAAVFQGQTAVATITQTNVLTAAQAASAAGATGGATGGGAGGGSAGAGGAAAGGGGGGLSATTIAIVGGAVAGGAVAATQIAGGSAQGKSYSGPISGQYLLSYSRNGVPGCTRTVNFTGTLKLEIKEDGGNVSGKAESTRTDTEIATTCSSLGGAVTNSAGDIPVSGPSTSITFKFERTGPPRAGNPGDSVTDVLGFSGALANETVTGSLTIGVRISIAATGEIGTASVTVPVTLR